MLHAFGMAFLRQRWDQQHWPAVARRVRCFFLFRLKCLRLRPLAPRPRLLRLRLLAKPFALSGVQIAWIFRSRIENLHRKRPNRLFWGSGLL